LYSARGRQSHASIVVDASRVSNATKHLFRCGRRI
jgi:hypothetical protein